VPASVQDRDTLPALDAGKAEWPSLREATFDGAFTADRCRERCNLHGVRHRVIKRDPEQKGFVVLTGRWVIERSFGWLVPWGGLLRLKQALSRPQDYAGVAVSLAPQH
jgi:transposase